MVVVELEIDLGENINALNDKLRELEGKGYVLVRGMVKQEPNGRYWFRGEFLKPKTTEWYVCVWNCKAHLVIKRPEGPTNIWYVYTPTEEAKKLAEQVIHQVVYKDNKGAINLSGVYYPLSDESVRLFEKLIEELEKVKENAQKE